eukprot:5687896-Pyramimonas_sp.AAC.1
MRPGWCPSAGRCVSVIVVGWLRAGRTLSKRRWAGGRTCNNIGDAIGDPKLKNLRHHASIRRHKCAPSDTDTCYSNVGFPHLRRCPF